MKKQLGTLILTTALALSFTACSNKEAKPEAAQEEEPNFRCRIDSQLAPEWACGNASFDGLITSVGSAPLSKLGQGFSRREALANGRSNLAQQIQVTVKDKVTTFARSTGVADGEVADKVSTQVSNQVAKQTLSGSKQKSYWQNPANNDIYVLVSVDENSVNSEVKKQVISSFKNDDALWQQFQAKQALESLEKEFPTN